mmetsp:Transcript_13149/g.27924  ORF Transcript_13149/g.27924 Transcript_13149/m.27924 type:complete len:202 (-) Transcript_13149:636-1241(-)
MALEERPVSPPVLVRISSIPALTVDNLPSFPVVMKISISSKDDLPLLGSRRFSLFLSLVYCTSRNLITASFSFNSHSICLHLFHNFRALCFHFSMAFCCLWLTSANPFRSWAISSSHSDRFMAASFVNSLDVVSAASRSFVRPTSFSCKCRIVVSFWRLVSLSSDRRSKISSVCLTRVLCATPPPLGVRKSRCISCIRWTD